MVSVEETGIVYENPKPYLRSQHAFHPTIVNLGGGELVCCYDLGQAVESLDYATHRSRSTDGGATWTAEGPLIGRPPGRPTTHSIRVSPTTAGLVGFGGLFYRDDPEEGLVNRRTFGYVPMDLIIVRSRDRGRSWQEPEIVPPPIPGACFETCHSIVELPGGRWLAPTSTWPDWEGRLPSGEKAIVLISEDRGVSWPRYGVSFDGGPEGLKHWEQSLVSLGGDSLLAVSWVYDPKREKNLPNRYAASDDGGRTFSAPREVGIRGQTCKAAALGGGRILLAYRRSDRPGLWAAEAELARGTLKVVGEHPLWGTGLSSSGMDGRTAGADELSGLKFGFPQMTLLQTGVVFLVFWCFEDWCTKIRWMRLRIS